MEVVNPGDSPRIASERALGVRSLAVTKKLIRKNAAPLPSARDQNENFLVLCRVIAAITSPAMTDRRRWTQSESSRLFKR
jgi:hypothetical protein